MSTNSRSLPAVLAVFVGAQSLPGGPVVVVLLRLAILATLVAFYRVD